MTSPVRHCHSILSLAVIDCHSLGVYTLTLLSLLALTVKMTVSPVATPRACSAIDLDGDGELRREEFGAAVCTAVYLNILLENIL